MPKKIANKRIANKRKSTCESERNAKRRNSTSDSFVDDDADSVVSEDCDYRNVPPFMSETEKSNREVFNVANVKILIRNSNPYNLRDNGITPYPARACGCEEGLY